MSALTTEQAAAARYKRSAEYAEALWKKWPTAREWPGVLDLYEAAAYLRVCYNTVRRACLPDRKGRAALRHQRLGAAYRITREALDRFGVVEERTAA